MKIKKLTVLIDEESNECLYIDGIAWESTGEVTVYCCDIAEHAGDAAIIFKHEHIGHCHDRWPRTLAEAVKPPATAIS